MPADRFPVPPRRCLSGWKLLQVAACLLIPASPVGAATFTWTGTFNNQWSLNAGFPTTNWGGFLPSGGDDLLVFPAAGANKAMLNTFSASTVFHRLEFTGTGYTLSPGSSVSPNPLMLGPVGATRPEIRVSHGAGTTVIATVVLTDDDLSLPLVVENEEAVLEMQQAIGTGNTTSSLISGAGTVHFNTRLAAGVSASMTGDWIVGTGSDTPTLRLNGDLRGYLLIRSGATVAGDGFLGQVAGDNVTVEGTLAPGDGSVFPEGEFSLTGSLIGASTGRLVFSLQAPNNHDAILVPAAGTVTCGSARVELQPRRAFDIGDTFVLIRNDGTDPIDNTPPFRLPSGAPITEGLEVNIGFNRWRFSYGGGSGNDFSATVVLGQFTGVREWDAGGTTRDFSEAANWASNALPQSTQTLRFGSLAPAVPLVERFPLNDTGGNFYSLEFTEPGYSLQSSSSGGRELLLAGGISATHTSSVVEIDTTVRLGAPQAISLSGNGSLRFGLDATVFCDDHALELRNTGTGELRVNGRLSGSSSNTFTKTGSGFLTLGGTNPFSFQATLRVNEGELRLARSTVNTAVIAPLFAGGAGADAGIVINAPDQIAETAIVTLLDRSLLTMNAADTLGALNLQGGDTAGTGPLSLTGLLTATETAILGAPLHFIAGGGSTPGEWNIATSATCAITGALTHSLPVTSIGLRKTGPGTLVISGTAAGTNIGVEAGAAELTGTIATVATGAGFSLRGGRVTGRGTAAFVTGTAGQSGEFDPGRGTQHGTFITGRMALAPANIFSIDITNATPATGYDRVEISNGSTPLGCVPGGAQLVLRQSAPVAIGSTLVIVDNDGTDAVSGTFAGLAQNALVSSAGNTFAISYTGGTGNDITLTAVTAPEIGVGFGPDDFAQGGTFTYPNVKIAGFADRAFSIRNTGTGTLNLSGTPRVQITGPGASSFTVQNQPPATVGIGSSTPFTIRFAPVTAGLKQAVVSIANNDADEAPYVFNLQGSALPDPKVTAITVTKGSPAAAGSVNLTVGGLFPAAQVRIQASGDLSAWTTIRTLTTDDAGGIVTGVINDPGSTGQARRFYRALQP